MEIVEREVIGSSHDWAVNKVEKILKARIWPKTWEIIEKKSGSKTRIRS